MSRLYLREAFLAVGTRKFNTRIGFDIKKNDQSNPNKAKISLYNLSDDSRAFLENTKEQMRLEAGYSGDIGIIFWGDISKKTIKHERQGGDIVTTLLCGDGQASLASAHIEMSWEKGVTCQQILDRALQKLGLNLRVKTGDLSKQYLHGKAYSGTVKQLIDEIATYCGLRWNVQNNAVQIYPKGRSATSEAFLLSETTGLIGIPSKTEKGVTVRSLLNAKLIPGGLIKLETKAMTGSGTYTIKDVKHVGDTHEGDWYTEVEGEVQGAE